MATSDFKIEQGIPVAPTRKKYPFEEMEIGDSFFVPEGPYSDSSFFTVSAVAYATKRRLKKKGKDVTFTARRVEGGTRVWRTK